MMKEDFVIFERKWREVRGTRKWNENEKENVLMLAAKGYIEKWSMLSRDAAA